MWLLSPVEDANTSKCVVLVAGAENVVGRKDCTVLIQNDPSISRKHAVITVHHKDDNLVDPNKLAEVFLEDSSKYGTFLNGNRISGTVRLKPGDKILFGKNNSHFRVTYIPLVVITSCLDDKKKKMLRSTIFKLGGHVVNEWKPSIVTHLVMDGLTFTIKVIHALADCCSIVMPSYFEDIANRVETESTLPQVERYLPPLKEETISSQGASFLPKEARRTLFTGKTFILISKKQYKRIRHAIELSGGKTVLRDTQDSETSIDLVSRDVCVMMVDPKEHKTLPTTCQLWITRVVETLRRHGCRPIPESEVGLALLYMSLDKYCNPSINAVPLLTQSLVSQSFQVTEVMSQNFGLEQITTEETPFKKPTRISKHPSETNTQPERRFDQRQSILEHNQDDHTAERKNPGKRCAIGQTVVDTVPDTQADSQSIGTSPKRRKLASNDISAVDDTCLISGMASLDRGQEELARKTNGDQKLEISDSVVADTLEMNFEFGSELDTEEESQVPNGKQVNKVGIVADSLDFNQDNRPSFVDSIHDVVKQENWKSLVQSRQQGELSLGELTHAKSSKNEGQRSDEDVTERRPFVKPSPKDSWSGADDALDEKEPDVPRGFLCTRLPRKISKDARFEDEDSSLPRNLVVVDEALLLVSRRNASLNTENRMENKLVKNFKKFKKQLFPGSGVSLPRIIGGSDLTLYQAFERFDKDEWLLEAREADAERQREERLADELFRWEGKPTGGRRSRR